jgi:hypothetical protein
MRAREFISEIGFAYYLNNSVISDEEFIQHSEDVGSIDGHTVWYWQGRDQYIGNHAYLFADTSAKKVLARIGFADKELTSIRNITGVRSAVTALCVFIVNEIDKPFVIPDTEPFTPDGVTWLCNLIRDGGRGIKITDNHGNYPDSDALRQEWITAKYSGKPGPTKLFFSGNGVKINIHERIKRIETPSCWIERAL